MNRQKITMDNVLDKLTLTTPPIKTVSGNTYQYAKQKNSNPQYPYEFMFKTINNLSITPQLKDRLTKIKNLPQHDNISFVYKKGIKEKPSNQVFILSHYLESAQNLEALVRETANQKKKQLKSGQFNYIFYQITKAMAFLQENQLNHLRLNPNAIITKFRKQEDEKPIVQICDIGIQYENSYLNHDFMHPDLLDTTKPIDPYGKTYQECVKYDMWALGVMIYYLYKKRKPFYGVTSFLNQQLKFKIKHARDPESWLSKNDNGFTAEFSFQKMIVHFWGLWKSKVFLNWGEALNFYETEMKMRQIPINTIFQNHVRLMYFLCQLYKLMKEDIDNEPNFIWLKAQDQNDLRPKLSECIFKISDLYHCEEFVGYFDFYCAILPLFKRKMIIDMKEYFENERQHLNSSSIFYRSLETKGPSQNKLSQLMSKSENSTVRLCLILSTLPSTSKHQKLKILEKILQQMKHKIIQATKVHSDILKNRLQFLNVMYESIVFKQIAIKDFGFQLPKHPIFHD